MPAKTAIRATIALLAWVTAALVTGYYSRGGIEQIFGPDSWWLVTGWVGIVIGLVHFLIIFIFARQPRSSQ